MYSKVYTYNYKSKWSEGFYLSKEYSAFEVILPEYICIYILYHCGPQRIVLNANNKFIVVHHEQK